jgi:outer membrane lipoprotein-sorting protein
VGVNARRRLLTSIISACMVPALFATAGCGSSKKGGSARSTGAGSPAATSQVASLLAAMQQGINSVSSAHVTTIQSVSGSQTLTGQGDQTLRGGKLTAMDFTEQMGATRLRMLLIGSSVYAQLPRSLNRTGKPWVQATPNSKSPALATVARSVNGARESATLDAFGTFSQAATSMKVVGQETVGGVVTTRYTLLIDVSKLPPASDSTKALNQAGIKTLPVDLWLDVHGRPVQGRQTFTYRNQTFSTVLSVSRYNARVNIQAPPPNQVGML